MEKPSMMKLMEFLLWGQQCLIWAPNTYAVVVLIQGVYE